MPISPRARQALLVAAEEVLIQLARGRDLEALDAYALRIDAAHDVADRAVLAGGVERLEHDHHAVRRLSGQALLKFCEERDAVVQQPDAVLLLLDARLERGVEVLRQGHAGPGGHAERRDEARDPLGDVVGHVVVLSSSRAGSGPIASRCYAMSRRPPSS